MSSDGEYSEEEWSRDSGERDDAELTLNSDDGSQAASDVLENEDFRDEPQRNGPELSSTFELYGDPADFLLPTAEDVNPAEPRNPSVPDRGPCCPVCKMTYEDMLKNNLFFVKPPCGEVLCYRCAWYYSIGTTNFVCPRCETECNPRDIIRIYL